MEKNTFNTCCPKCHSLPNDAKLEVREGSFIARGVRLYGDGFDLTENDYFETYGATVYCKVCHSVFPLTECVNVPVGEGTPPP